MKETKERSPLAKNVAERRASLGLSQEEFAEIAKVGISTLKNIERGTSSGQPITRHLIAEALGCTVDDLMSETNPLTLRAYPEIKSPGLTINVSKSDAEKAELILFVSALEGDDVRDALLFLKRMFTNKTG